MSKKSWPILFSYLLHKIGHDFLDFFYLVVCKRIAIKQRKFAYRILIVLFMMKLLGQRVSKKKVSCG